jgi:hypothetical protein
MKLKKTVGSIKVNQYLDELFFVETSKEQKKTNKFGFMSDNFIKKHDGLHIVFTGCSVTSGVGLKKEEVWSNLLYKKISEKEKCSGYFNLAIRATGLCDQILNLFKYFKIYGNPDIIFINITNEIRFYASENNKIRHGFFHESEKKLILFLYKQYYNMLETYCLSKNIQLYSFTWVRNESSDLPKEFEKNFKTFYRHNDKDRLNFIFDYNEKNLNKKYVLKARDGIHHGTAFHEYWKEFMYEIYQKHKIKN